MFGLIPLSTFQSTPLIENSIETKQSFSFELLINCALLILRNDFPYKENVRASRIVDLPAPLDPTISVVGSELRLTSVK